MPLALGLTEFAVVASNARSRRYGDRRMTLSQARMKLKAIVGVHLSLCPLLGRKPRPPRSFHQLGQNNSKTFSQALNTPELCQFTQPSGRVTTRPRRFVSPMFAGNKGTPSERLSSDQYATNNTKTTGSNCGLRLCFQPVMLLEANQVFGFDNESSHLDMATWHLLYQTRPETYLPSPSMTSAFGVHTFFH